MTFPLLLWSRPSLQSGPNLPDLFGEEDVRVLDPASTQVLSETKKSVASLVRITPQTAHCFM